MKKLRQALTRKFGPLPAWAWLAALAGALYWYQQHKAASSSNSSTNGTGAVSSTGTSSPAYYPDATDALYSDGGATGNSGDPGTTPVVYDPATDTYTPASAPPTPATGSSPLQLLPVAPPSTTSKKPLLRRRKKAKPKATHTRLHKRRHAPRQHKTAAKRPVHHSPSSAPARTGGSKPRSRGSGPARPAAKASKPAAPARGKAASKPAAKPRVRAASAPRLKAE